MSCVSEKIRENSSFLIMYRLYELLDNSFIKSYEYNQLTLVQTSSHLCSVEACQVVGAC